jgi:hypothetical protein
LLLQFLSGSSASGDIITTNTIETDIATNEMPDQQYTFHEGFEFIGELSSRYSIHYGADPNALYIANSTFRYSGESGLFVKSDRIRNQANLFNIHLDISYDSGRYLRYYYYSVLTTSVIRVSVIDNSGLRLDLDYGRVGGNLQTCYTTSHLICDYNIQFLSGSWQSVNRDLSSDLALARQYSGYSNYQPTVIERIEVFVDNAQTLQSSFKVYHCLDDLILNNSPVNEIESENPGICQIPVDEETEEQHDDAGDQSATDSNDSNTIDDSTEQNETATIGLNNTETSERELPVGPQLPSLDELPELPVNYNIIVAVPAMILIVSIKRFRKKILL